MTFSFSLAVRKKIFKWPGISERKNDEAAHLKLKVLCNVTGCRNVLFYKYCYHSAAGDHRALFLLPYSFPIDVISAFPSLGTKRYDEREVKE
jgi:hypothetical protein